MSGPDLSGLADTARGVRGAAADGSLKAAPAKLVGGLLDEYGAEAQRRIDATTRDVAAKVATDKNLKGSLEIGAKLGAATTEAAKATAGTISGINEARLDGSLKDAVSDTLAASADAVKREAERQAKATTEYVAVGTSTNVGAITEKSVTAASKIAGAATEGAGAVAGTADAVKSTAGKAGASWRPRSTPSRSASERTEAATTTVKPCARGACPAPRPSIPASIITCTEERDRECRSGRATARMCRRACITWETPRISAAWRWRSPGRLAGPKLDVQTAGCACGAFDCLAAAVGFAAFDCHGFLKRPKDAKRHR